MFLLLCSACASRLHLHEVRKQVTLSSVAALAHVTGLLLHNVHELASHQLAAASADSAGTVGEAQDAPATASSTQATPSQRPERSELPVADTSIAMEAASAPEGPQVAADLTDIFVLCPHLRALTLAQCKVPNTSLCGLSKVAHCLRSLDLNMVRSTTAALPSIAMSPAF